MEQLNLFLGDDLILTDTIRIKHTTLKDIKECGYDTYSKYMTDLVTEPVDVADVLWCEGKIWYEDIKSAWDFFLQRAISDSKPKPVGFIDDGELIYTEDECLFVNEEIRNALNYFLNLKCEYIILSITKDDTKQNVIYALDWSEKFGLYILKKDCFKFTEYHYNIAKDYLRDINWFHPEYEFTHGGNKKAKKYILEYDYKKRKKSHRETVTLESIVSSLVARGQPYSEVINYPIYVVYNQYYRLVKVDEYQNTIHALYSGCLDTKKNPINWEKINWSSIIK